MVLNPITKANLTNRFNRPIWEKVVAARNIHTIVYSGEQRQRAVGGAPVIGERLSLAGISKVYHESQKRSSLQLFQYDYERTTRREFLRTGRWGVRKLENKYETIGKRREVSKEGGRIYFQFFFFFFFLSLRREHKTHVESRSTVADRIVTCKCEIAWW